MDKFSIDALLAKRGQRELFLPLQKLAIGGSDRMAPLLRQFFPRGLSPRRKTVVAPVQFNAGKLIEKNVKRTLQELDTIRPREERR